MKFISIFDVIGPNMIGPSSSHTAGAASIALLAREMFPGSIKKASFTLYGSFARTYKGHGTDRALLGGILGFSSDDPRIRDAYLYAREFGMAYEMYVDETTVTDHPNTVDIAIEGTDGQTLVVRGESTGGGKIRIVRINGIDVEFTGEFSTLIIKQIDKPGVVAHITECLSNHNVNIAFMRLFRHAKGGEAFTIVESDETLPDGLPAEIKQNESVHELMLIQV